MFPRASLKKVPRNLRQQVPKQLRQNFFQLFASEGFLDWWNQSTGGSGPKQDKYLRLSFPHTYIPFAVTAWDIPWELLIERLQETENHSTVALVRGIGNQALLATTVFSEKMRVLILQGDDGSSSRSSYSSLNLAAEARQLEWAWRNLPAAARDCMDQPLVLKTGTSDLRDQIHAIAPHVVWYSGHGRSEPNSALLFEGGKWVTAGEFANLIKPSAKGERAPLYAVFWACDTGRKQPRPETIPISPPLVEALSNVGVASVLAMQSPIGDASAVSAAGRLLEFLATGFSLERAVARVRARLMDDPPGHEMDWASLVVWSACEPAEHLQWNTPEQPLAQFQLMGSETLRWRRTKPAELEGLATEDELTKGSAWGALPRVWIHGNYDDAEIQYRWVRALQAVQIQTKSFVLAVDLRSSDVAEALREWAETLLSRIPAGDFPEAAIRCLSQMTRNQTTAWKRLCELPNISLAIANPPEYEEKNWFWQSLLEQRDDFHVMVVGDQQLPVGPGKSWSADDLEIAMSKEVIHAAVATAPRLATAIAVLNMPLSSYLLTVPAEEGEGANTLANWEYRDQIMIETSAGPIMSATARRHIINSLQDSGIVKQAHLDCVRMLDHSEVRFTPQVREKVIDHLLGADLSAIALDQATYLASLYREQDRPSAVLQLVKRLGSEWIDLPEDARLVLAWAHSYLGQPKLALYLLERTHPTLALDRAWKHGLQAEIYKSAGDVFSKEKALAEIDAAIEACRNAGEACRNAGPNSGSTPQLIQRRLRAYRQDRARILQFLFNDQQGRQQAASEYEKLIEEWKDQPEALLDVATVKRNYAECLRVLASGPDDPRLRKAHDILNEARLLTQDYPHAPILAEILYEKAKTAEAEGNETSARNELLAAQQAALNSRHYMLWAIAQSRHFWKYETFTLDRWEEIKTELAGFPNHGWAVRTLVDGCLRASHRLESNGDLLGAFAQLETAQAALTLNRAFDQGTDKFRIAATKSGLELIGRQNGMQSSSWATFLKENPWAEDWLLQRGAAGPETVWTEVR
jgi:hypothetical protein